MSEFEKEFPDDPDAAKKRFIRVDGARRRVLKEVKEEWKLLCKNGWLPEKSQRPDSAKERILEVAPSAHCTLLEINAERFRRIEEENWKALQRTLMIEVKKADLEQKNKHIIERHKEIEAMNQKVQEERKNVREQLFREQLERQQRKEEERMAEIRYQQQIDQQLAMQRSEEQRLARVRDKQLREKREAERVQQEQYTQHIKESIFTGQEERRLDRERVMLARDENTAARLQQQQKARADEMAERQRQKDERLRRAREDQRRQEEEMKRTTEEKMREIERQQKVLQEQRNLHSREEKAQTDNEVRQKLQRIKQTNDEFYQRKAERAEAELLAREEAAKVALQKVKDMQDRRRCMKQIRLEANQAAAMRAKKAEEHRMMRIMQDLEEKDARCEAIKKSFSALNDMRNSMKDVMEKTQYELKSEFERLKHKDKLAPNTVAAKALLVGKETLFPRLERVFGMTESAAAETPVLHLRPRRDTPSSRLVRREEKRRQQLGSPVMDLDLDSNDGNMFAFEASPGSTRHKTGKSSPDRMSPGQASSGPDTGRSRKRVATAGGGKPHSGGFVTLPIKKMTQQRLMQALRDSKDKIQRDDEIYQQGFSSRQGSPNRSRNRLSQSPSRGSVSSDDSQGRTFRTQQDQGSDNGSVPPPILNISVDPTIGRHSAPAKTDPAEVLLDTAIWTANEAIRVATARASSRATTPVVETRGTKSQGLPKEVKVVEKRKGRSRRRKKTVEDSGPDDINLPVFAFAPLGTEEKARTPGDRGSTAGKPKKFRSSMFQLSRTDVNEKAKFLAPPPGKFRREFSNDHPLAAGGKGKYSRELKRGVTPTGLSSLQPTTGSQNVANTLETAGRVERLTYRAQTKVVDADEQLEKLKKEQNDMMKQLLEVERKAEDERKKTADTVEDPEELRNLEHVFAEERRRASQRIIDQAKENDREMKQMVLALMNLGGTPSSHFAHTV